jgi:hypothetical protein
MIAAKNEAKFRTDQSIHRAREYDILNPPNESFLHSASNLDDQFEEQSAGKLEIKPSAVIPGNRGVFATVNLSKESIVCQYAGMIIRDKEYEAGKKAGRYPGLEREFPMNAIMSLHGAGGCPNTSVYGHHNTFGPTINHSESPNCKAIYKVPKSITTNPKKFVLIQTLRPIKAGEELFINYGPEANLINAQSSNCCSVCSEPNSESNPLSNCRGVIGLLTCSAGAHRSCFKQHSLLNDSQNSMENSDSSSSNSSNEFFCGWCLTRLSSN